MKLLVGTLHTIEREFEDCCASIREQTYKQFEHVIIRDLPNKAAHEALYGMFMERAHEFQLLVKVDADMVIRDRDLFMRIVDKFSSDKELDLLLIAVHDFFSDGLLMGVNVFRNTVQWDLGTEQLFTDMTYVKSSIRKKVKDFDELAPAAVHCGNPSPFQAFHYGFHRGMKAVRGGERHWRHLTSMFQHYRRAPDRRLAYAMLGANTALSGRFSVRHISYDDDALNKHFTGLYSMRPVDELHRLVKRSRLFWLLTLPIDRRIVSRYYQLKSRD